MHCEDGNRTSNRTTPCRAMADAGRSGVRRPRAHVPVGSEALRLCAALKLHGSFRVLHVVLRVGR